MWSSSRGGGVGVGVGGRAVAGSTVGVVQV